MQPVRSASTLRAYLLSLLVPVAALGADVADDKVGTLTQSEGTVQIFSAPSKTLPEKKEGRARALFEGQYYLVSDARVGDRVENGNVLRTAPGAKARVVFDNGDQFQVGPGTAYRVSWTAPAKEEARTRVELMYGKFRGVVVKEGPRKRMFLRSKSAVMGVRGTDFFVSENPASGETELSVLRGAIDVSPVLPSETDQAAVGREVEVKAGMTATVTPVSVAKSSASVEPSPTPDAAATGTKEIAYGKGAPVEKPEGLPKVDLHRLSKVDLRDIDRAAVVAAPKPADVPPKVAALEKKALEATLEDIRKSDPAHFAKIRPGSAKSVDDLHHGAVENLMADAPAKSARKRRKPVLQELEEEQDAYKKYFQFPGE
jgi:hypothetical protein